MILFLNPDVARALSDGKFIEIVRLFLYGEGIDGIVSYFHSPDRIEGYLRPSLLWGWKGSA